MRDGLIGAAKAVSHPKILKAFEKSKIEVLLVGRKEKADKKYAARGQRDSHGSVYRYEYKDSPIRFQKGSDFCQVRDPMRTASPSQNN